VKPILLHFLPNQIRGTKGVGKTRLNIVPVLTHEEPEPGDQLTEVIREFLLGKVEEGADSATLLLWAREARVENLAEWANKYRNLWMDGKPAESIRSRMAAASTQAWVAAALHSSSEVRDTSILGLAGIPVSPHAISLIVEGDEGRTAFRESQDPSSLEIIQPPSLAGLLVDWSIPDDQAQELLQQYLVWERAAIGGKTLEHRQPLIGLENLREALRLRQWDYLLVRYSEREGETWLQNLALAWLRWKREEDRSVPMLIRRAIVTNENGDQFTPLPLAVEHASYLFGGPVVVNGENYAREPGQSGAVVGQLLKPRAIDIVPEDWSKMPRQLSFEAVELDMTAPVDRDVEDYLIVTATHAAAANLDLPAMAAKLVPLMFATSPMDGRSVHGTLEDAAMLLYPNLSGRDGRKHKARDLARIGAALAAMRRLRLVEKRDNGRLHSYSLFSVAYDLSAEADAEVEWALDPLLASRMKGGGNEKGGGFFLVNFSRLMAMDIKNPRLFALYLRLAGMWNSAKDFKAGKFRPELFKPIDLDQLATLTNSIPRNAAEYMAGKRKDQSSRVAYYEARKRLIGDLEDLKDRGMIGDLNLVNPHGKPWTIKPMPDNDLQEAYRLAVRKERTPPPKDA
jgi:hypothetical protein